MHLPVGLEDANGRLEPERACYDAGGAGDYEPCLETAFGEVMLLRQWRLLCFDRGVMILGMGDLGEVDSLQGRNGKGIGLRHWR